MGEFLLLTVKNLIAKALSQSLLVPLFLPLVQASVVVVQLERIAIEIIVFGKVLLIISA
jgi:hypothetical protein